MKCLRRMRKNIRFCSALEQFTDKRRAKWLLLNLSDLKSGFILTPVLSTWLQQRATEVSSIVWCLFTVMLTRAAGEIYFPSWMLRHGEGERKERSGVSGECWIYWDLTWMSQIFTYKVSSTLHLLSFISFTSSLSGSLLVVIATGNQMENSATASAFIYCFWTLYECVFCWT